MTPNNLIVLALAALFAAYLFVLWYVGARRRDAKRKAQAIASQRRRKSEAWQRLNHSAAGAP